MTSIEIIASKEGRLYTLRIEVEAIWEPLDAADHATPDLLPDGYHELVLGNGNGFSRYKFPEEAANDRRR